ncbi:MAG TPA: hypothetical protein VE777_01050 [Gaiellales bacterium]|jgi:hypothetical protein|nr:hypothetical protein [Gaiellales bacterium]
MPRRGSLFWAVVAVLTAGVLVYGPAELARRSTGSGEPVDFLTHPQEGWRFVLTALDEIGSAQAGSPTRARDLAVRAFAGTSVEPVRVDLLYVPDRRVPLGAGSGEVTAKGRLVWKVSGRTRPGGPIRTVGLIDFATGELTYDVRTAP